MSMHETEWHTGQTYASISNKQAVKNDETTKEAIRRLVIYKKFEWDQATTIVVNGNRVHQSETGFSPFKIL